MSATARSLPEACARARRPHPPACAPPHDPSQLLRVIVETAVEATGAAGGTIVGPHGEVARIGSRGPRHELLELPLSAGRSSFGTLTLYGDHFDEDERITAATLA